jgi:predicted site-specific integrase-resolvase
MRYDEGMSCPPEAVRPAGNENGARFLPRRAVIYARVSTVDRGQDPETQLRPLREYAKRRGFKVVGDTGLSNS